MRHFKKLTKEDLQYIVENAPKQSREEVAKHLGITKATLASYLTQLRKLGITIPRSAFSGNRAIIMEFVEEWKKNHEKI